MSPFPDFSDPSTAARPAEAPAVAAPDPRLDRFLAEVRKGIERWAPALLTRAVAELESSAQRNAVTGDRQHTASAQALLRAGQEGLRRRVAQNLAQAVDTYRRGGADAAAAAADEHRGAAGGTLTLIDEAQIDEDIETGRLVQIIDSGAEAELRHLAGLCSGLRRLDFVDPAAVPLRPLAVAQALRSAVIVLAPDPGARALLLRVLGQVAGEDMRAVYATHADLAERWGVAAAPLRLKLTDGSERLTGANATGAAAHPHARDPLAEAAPPGGPASPAASPLKSSLVRLVQHAQAQLAQAAPETDSDAPLTLRLSPQPRPVGSTSATALDRQTAERLMDQLFAHLEGQVLGSTRGRELLRTLREPGRALAGDEPQVWQRLDHPLWRLLEQLIDSSRDDSSAADPESEILHAALGEAVERVARAPSQDPSVWQRAEAQVRAAADRAVSERAEELVSRLGPLRTQVDEQETEVELRNQLVQQLRSTPVCQELRQFLLGPWAQVLARGALTHGVGSAQLDALAVTVDDLIHALAQPGRPVSSAQRAVLLRQVQTGLSEAGLPDSRVEATVADLRSLLRQPPAHAEPEWTEPSEPVPSPWVLDLNAALPTVPLDMSQADDAPPETRQQAWFDTLAAGRHCRLFLLGRWMTVQLSWVSDKRNLFLFTSRHGGRTHSLTRRMLEKLLEAGLAAVIDDGLLLAQAMDSMVETQLGAG